MPAKKHSLTLKNDLSELDRLHPFLQELGQRMGVSKKCIFETNLTLEEVFTNIVSYGFDDHADHFIRITVTIGKASFKVGVEDDGKPFNPLKVKKPDLPDKVEDCEPGGLGIHLIKHFMDDIKYKRYRNRNILTLTKKACLLERANSTEKLRETSY